MGTIRIALLQLDSGPNLAATLDKGLEACRDARRSGADIALFPEIWSHGYRFFDPTVPGSEGAWRASALDLGSEFVRGHQQLASELDMAIGTTFLEAHKTGPRNTFILIDRHGEIMLRYAKVHTCLHDLERLCAPGDDYFVETLDTEKGPVEMGAMICYDREFPETARVLALRGAEIVLVPNACLFDDHRLAQMKTRAFENKLVLAMANYPDSHPAGNGRSLGISAVAFANEPPDGNRRGDSGQSFFRETLCLEAGPDEGVFVFDIDLDELRHYRRNAIWGAVHRRPETYGELVHPGSRPESDRDQLIS